MGYGCSTGNVLMDAALPIAGLAVDLDQLLLRCPRSLALPGRSEQVKITRPSSAGDWVATLEGAAVVWFFVENEESRLTLQNHEWFCRSIAYQ